MEAERAVIELQSMYAATGDRDYLLALLSHIDTSQGVSTMDTPRLKPVKIFLRGADAVLFMVIGAFNEHVVYHAHCHICQVFTA